MASTEPTVDLLSELFLLACWRRFLVGSLRIAVVWRRALPARTVGTEAEMHSARSR